MNSKNRKRPRGTRDNVQKRQKIDNKDASSDSYKIAHPAGAPVGIDDLAWKEVSLPDRLEDAEGFFGLEEIDDVEVIRDGDIVQYKLAGHNQPKAKPNGHNESEDRERAPDADLPDWEGFDSEQSANGIAGSSIKPNPGNIIKSGKDPKLASKKAIRPQAKEQPSPSSGPQSNGFRILEDFEEKSVDISAWRPLKLTEDVLSALSKSGFSKPTSIQAAAIPQILEGYDVIGKASTGSGKTLAFGIPILESFLQRSEAKTKNEEARSKKDPLALILSPTRELAHQLSTHINDLCCQLTSERPRVVTLTGGLSIHKQERLLAQADVVVGTPGRLWEILSSTAGCLEKLRKIRFLVIDEADRLLSEGHFKEAEQIIDSLVREEDLPDNRNHTKNHPSSSPSHRQTLVFSATFSKDLQLKLTSRRKPSTPTSEMTKSESLSYLLQKLPFKLNTAPKFVDVSPTTHLATKLKSGLLECGALEKDLYLYSTILLQPPSSQILVFTNSISAVRRLTPFLQTLNITVHPLHSEMPQKARLRSIERFSSPLSTSTSTDASTAGTAGGGSSGASASSVLVATDVAARGLDLPSIHLVLHYHVPRAADAYVHRSGRTARAEASGTSIMLCSPEEALPVRRLVGRIHSSSSSSSSSSTPTWKSKSTTAGESTEKKGKDGESGDAALKTLSLSPTLVARLRPRVALAQNIVSAGMSAQKAKAERAWLAKAAEDLGVEYDSEEFGKDGKGGSGNGGGGGREMATKKKKKKARDRAEGASGEQVAAWKAELKGLLGRRVNLGVSERYLFGRGGVDVDVEGLLRESEGGERSLFLGGLGGEAITGWDA